MKSLCTPDKRLFSIFLLLYLLLSIYLIYTIPFSRVEEDILSGGAKLTELLISNIYTLYPSKVAIRIPFLLISLLSIALILEISKIYLEREEYYLLATLIFIYTPGFFVSSILVNSATIPIFLTLILIYGYLKGSNILKVISLVLLFFTESAQVSIYIAVVAISISKREWFLLVLALTLFLLKSIYLIEGVPKGHLKTLLGIYAVSLSPFYFLAILYSVYRVSRYEDKPIIWYITLSAVTLSIALSIRQKIVVTDFTPFIVVSAPLVIMVFKKSVSIRLPIFRRKYYILCKTVLSVLLLETSLIALDYPIYSIFKKDINIIDKRIYKSNFIEKK
jgi:hypothetical protein